MNKSRSTVRHFFDHHDYLYEAQAYYRLEAELDRLREALTAIAEYHIPEVRNDYQAIARAALEFISKEIH